MRHQRALAVPLLAAALSAAGCVSTQDIEGINSQLSEIQRQVLQVQRQSSSKEDVENLDAQVGRQMDSLLKTEADMQVKLQDLSRQIDELQAKLEDTNYRIGQLSQQIATTNQELKAFRPAPLPPDTGLPPSDAAGGTNPPGQTTPPAATPRPPAGGGGGGSDPKSLYDASYNDYLKGNHDLAIRGFQQYLDEYPGTDLADNATYWIGESYYRQRRFRQAIEQFDEVLARYGRSDKTAGALLKKGYSHLELGERTPGISELQKVLRQFPTSDEANLARGRLREIGVDIR
ncbi:MAG TPA: tol-pal system protein YbgF [Thermoanaerobaculia bacterium]|nr:tol-pal system protein YbgF [Thermoanaerobaculia bacterium]